MDLVITGHCTGHGGPRPRDGTILAGLGRQWTYMSLQPAGKAVLWLHKQRRWRWEFATLELIAATSHALVDNICLVDDNNSPLRDGHATTCPRYRDDDHLHCTGSGIQRSCSGYFVSSLDLSSSLGHIAQVKMTRAASKELKPGGIQLRFSARIADHLDPSASSPI